MREVMVAEGVFLQSTFPALLHAGERAAAV